MLTELFVKAQSWWGDIRARSGEDRGATAVEYGVLVALIIAVLVAVIAAIGQKTSTAFSTVDACLDAPDTC